MDKIARIIYHSSYEFGLDFFGYFAPRFRSPDFERIGCMTALFIYANFILPLLLLGIGYIAVRRFEAQGKNNGNRD